MEPNERNSKAYYENAKAKKEKLHLSNNILYRGYLITQCETIKVIDRLFFSSRVKRFKKY